MQIKIEISTPPGMANRFNAVEGKIILGFIKPKETYVNADRSKLVWVIEESPRKVLFMQQKIAMFETIMKQTMDNKKVRYALTKMADNKGELDKLDAMLCKGTKVKVIKQATANELAEDGKTWWQRVKETWQKE